jgi:hypothetical protein
MDEHLYRELLEKLRLKFERISQEHDQDVQALQRVWRLANGTEPPIAKQGESPAISFVNASDTTSSSAPGKGTKEAVQEAVDRFQNSFTFHEVISEIESKRHFTPRARTVMQILRQMTDNKELGVVRQGAGKRPTKYTRLIFSTNGKH